MLEAAPWLARYGVTPAEKVAMTEPSQFPAVADQNERGTSAYLGGRKFGPIAPALFSTLREGYKGAASLAGGGDFFASPGSSDAAPGFNQELMRTAVTQGLQGSMDSPENILGIFGSGADAGGVAGLPKGAKSPGGTLLAKLISLIGGQ